MILNKQTMRKVFFFYLFWLLITGIILPSCEKDNVEDLNGSQSRGCDTSKAISFKNQVEPILKNECGSQSGCHGSGAASGGVDLENSQKILEVVNSGLFIKSIDHASGVSPMPKGRSQIDDCRRNLIRKWIREGASFSN